MTEYELTHWTLRDLDIPNYWGKWRTAANFADLRHPVASFDWYLTARRHFLELGGCYLNEKARK